MTLLYCVAGMESEAGSVVVGAVGSPADPCVATPSSPYFLDSALPSDSDLNYDHHSSEEELEVINSTPHHSQEIVRSRSASTVPEKRKWSQRTQYGVGIMLWNPSSILGRLRSVRTVPLNYVRMLDSITACLASFDLRRNVNSS
ncbi:hypothetical protein J6590_006368 [Homalodisca vitripennis]|nr:hypothetical protein J6590_006368 [Homalodisca vitripennis]